eukprot:GHRQ01020133.1.p1 GENE.GHRQ01020133.1~~GHRQ01020133.1.p1  ORF type:complete len:474 (+),score=83.01 GHRQ01020133.1:365-1786(+)
MFKLRADDAVLRDHSKIAINLWAKGLPNIRMMTVMMADDRAIVFAGFITQGYYSAHNVYYIVNTVSNGVPEADVKKVFSTDNTITNPYGVAVYGPDLYIAGFKDGKGVIWKLPDMRASALAGKTFPDANIVIVTDQLPGDDGCRIRRALRVMPGGWRAPGDSLVVGISAACDTCPANETSGSGAIYRVAVSGGARQKLASGIREVGDMDFHPVTRDLCLTDSPRDAVPQGGAYELNCIPEAVWRGNTPAPPPDFGYPYCYTSGTTTNWSAVADPDVNRRGAQLNCASGSNVKSLLAFEKAKMPVGLRFYVNNPAYRQAAGNVPWRGFVPSYNSTALIVEHGASGGRLVAVDLNGKSGSMAASNYRRLVHGWELPVSPLAPAGSPGWGRPIAVEALIDGSVLVADSLTGSIYRITPDPGNSNFGSYATMECRDKNWESTAPVAPALVSAAGTAQFSLYSCITVSLVTLFFGVVL